MTLISDSHKFVFIHIPKTGGTSIKAVLTPLSSPTYLEKRADNKHLTVNELETSFPKMKSESYFSFAFIRNPWDRLLSFYSYKLENPFHDDYIDVLKLGSFEAFIDNQHKTGRISQSRFICDFEGNQILDFIGRFETLRDDFNGVCDIIGLDQPNLPHKNSSDHKTYRDAISPKARSMIELYCQDDIERFGYRF